MSRVWNESESVHKRHDPDSGLGSLRAAVLRHSVKFSESVTKDGGLLEWCIDLRQLLYRPIFLRQAATLLWRRIQHLNPEFIGGMTLSAEQLTAGVLQAALDGGREVVGFSIRKEPKSYGLRRHVEGAQPTPGARVVLVDDLFDSGETIASAISALAPFGADIVGVAAVVDFLNPSFAERIDASVEHTALISLEDLGICLPRAAPIRSPLWTREPLNAGDYTAPQSGPLIDAEGVLAAGDTGFVIAFDHAGREIWRLKTADNRDGVRTALTPYGNSILFCGFDGYAYRVDRASGRIIWSVRLGDFIGATPAVDGAGGLAYVAANRNDRSSEFLCLSLADGNVLWRRPVADYAYARPAIAGGVVIRASNNGEVEGLSLDSGDPAWRVQLPAQVKGWIVADGPRCFLGCFDGCLYALDPATGVVVWRKRLATWLLIHPAATSGDLIVSAESHLCRLSQKDGAICWLAPIDGRATGVAVSAEYSLCLVGSDSGLVCALDLATGERRWQFEAAGAIRATPAVCGSLCALPSYDGALYVFNLGEGASAIGPSAPPLRPRTRL